MAFSITTNNVGEVWEDFIRYMVTGNELVDEGCINIISGINTDLFMPRIDVTGSIWQTAAATPSSSGTLTYDERQLDPQPWMIYTEFNPQDFRQVWKNYAPSADQLLYDTTLPPEVEREFLDALLQRHFEDTGEALIQGDIVSSPVGSYPNGFFNGILTRARNDAAVVDIASPVALTENNIISKIKACYEAAPKAVRKSADFKFLVSEDTALLYENAQIAKTYKGGNDIDSTDTLRQYKGKKIVGLVGCPDDVIMAGNFSSTPQSNIHLGVTNVANHTSVKIERLQNNSELFFMQMRMKADTQIAKGNEFVLYDAV
jgi:hypothetical protein